MIQALIDNLPLILTTLGAIAGAVVAVVTLLRSRRLEKYLAQAKARRLTPFARIVKSACP